MAFGVSGLKVVRFSMRRRERPRSRPKRVAITTSSADRCVPEW